MEIRKILYTSTVSGRTSETLKLDETYGSENNENGYDDDEFDKGETMKTGRPPMPS